MNGSSDNGGDARRRRVYQFIESLTGIGSGVLMEQLGLPSEKADAIMDSIARAVVREHAKRYIYVPERAEIELDPRNQRIWDEYAKPGADGTRPHTSARVEQLAEQYGITWRTVYRILAYMRARESQARQMSLLEQDA